MSDTGKTYGVVEGMVQFDPKRERQVNGQLVCDVTIKSSNMKDPVSGEQRLVSITIWPEFAGVYAGVKKGDKLAVDGEIRTSMGQRQDGSPIQYVNISPSAIAWTASEVRQPRQVVQAPAVQAAPVVAVAPVAAATAPPVTTTIAPVAAPVATPPTAAPSLF